MDDAQFRACAGEIQEFGKTPLEALTALMARLPEDTSPPIVIWPFNRGDAFFADTQQARLRELKARREILTPTEQAELEQLVATSFEATIARAQVIQRVKS